MQTTITATRDRHGFPRARTLLIDPRSSRGSIAISAHVDDDGITSPDYIAIVTLGDDGLEYTTDGHGDDMDAATTAMFELIDAIIARFGLVVRR